MWRLFRKHKKIIGTKIVYLSLQKTNYVQYQDKKIFVFMKPKQENKSKFNGKKAPLFFTSLYLILCFVSIFSIDPVLWFLKYAALFGVLTAVLLIAYIIRTDELWE